MEILEIDVILINILGDINVEFIYNLLLTNKHLNFKITKYYKNGEITLNDMPLFKSCNNISTYLNHYKSYISGKDFPKNPIWLFDNEDDCKYVEIDGKYVKLENVKFDRPRFFNYFSYYEYIPFKGGFYYWSKLNDEQKYLIWCAITNYHPEIKLSKTLICSDSLIDLLIEIYWHYQKTFVRYYLEIYCIDNCYLMNAKLIAQNEITSELEHYRGNHFLQGHNDAPDKKLYLNNYFDLHQFSTTQACQENKFRLQLMYMIADNGLDRIRSFENLNTDSDNLLKEINILLDILNEISEFNITKTSNLKTTNINYLDHMSINHPVSKNIKHFVNVIKNTNQEDIANVTNVINESCIQQ